MSYAVVVGFMLLATLGLPIAFAMGVSAIVALWLSGVDFSMVPQRMKVILFRNVLFSVVISVIPALLPVVALKEANSSAAQLGLIFTCVGIGSLVGAVILLPLLRARITPNAIISTAMVSPGRVRASSDSATASRRKASAT